MSKRNAPAGKGAAKKKAKKLDPDSVFDDLLGAPKKRRPTKKKKDDSESEEAIFSSSDSEFDEPSAQSESEKDEEVDIESQDDASPSSEEEGYGDGYGSDLMGDAEDRAKMAAMPEFEREEILASRFEARQRILDRRKIRAKRREERKAKKKMASSRRQKDARTRQTEKKKKSALAEIKSKRAKEGAEKKKKQQLKEEVSDDSAEFEEDDDDEYEQSDKDDYDADDVEELTATDLSEIQATREMLVNWLDEAYFETVVQGLFTRVGIGLSPNEGRSIYRICEVIGVKPVWKTYRVMGVETTKGLIVRTGNEEKTFGINIISNSPFTDEEFRWWKNQMDRQFLHIVTKAEVAERKYQIEKTINFAYTNDAIQEELEQRQKSGNWVPPSFATEKLRLKDVMGEAKEANDTETYEEAERQLKKILELEKEKDRATRKGLNSLNIKNRKVNDQVLAKEVAGRKKSGKSDFVDDGFVRQPTRSQMTVAKSAAEEKEEEERLKKEKEEQDGGDNGAGNAPETPITPRVHTPGGKMKDAHGAVKIEVDVDKVPQLSSVPSQVWKGVASNVKKMSSSAEKPAKALSLAEYKRRRFGREAA